MRPMERREMRFKLSEKDIEFSIKELLSNEAAAGIVADFMLSTGLLQQFHDTDPQAIGLEVIEEASDKG
ncbi:hypothetical protein N7478_005493 [Penicillium angulare]|uniref:uncharacterized protein n=1 Tax=Penicillium angulare TaxID=116970 RepID=UPI002541953F|nr:uncharacterized protein N7478_005493 [Penicillium angulare]KAJ5280121.1 hypothetical protein N7478_005493 [Penicillium angulare]